jgi:hypothetical protein
MQSIQLATFDVDGLRTRLRKMSDEELRKFGKAARYMVSPKANLGKPRCRLSCCSWRKLALSGAGDLRGLDFHMRRSRLDVTGERV